MHTVVETLTYRKAADDLFSEGEQQQIITTVATNPEAGDVIPGTGGFRKLRAGRAGMGKRGGARIIYFYGGEDFPVFLNAAYAKSEKGNISQAEKNKMAKIAKSFLKITGGKNEQIVR